LRSGAFLIWFIRLIAQGGAMTAWKPLSFSPSAICIPLLVLCAQSNALARAGGYLHEPPFSSERIDQLPPEVQNSVHHMCSVNATAAQYFATYLDHARIIRLHFEHFNCEGQQIHRELNRCLHEEFVRSGSHYRLLKTYFALCDD
jgi:hypothetical protein